MDGNCIDVQVCLVLLLFLLDFYALFQFTRMHLNAWIARLSAHLITSICILADFWFHRLNNPNRRLSICNIHFRPFAAAVATSARIQNPEYWILNLKTPDQTLRLWSIWQTATRASWPLLCVFKIVKNNLQIVHFKCISCLLLLLRPPPLFFMAKGGGGGVAPGAIMASGGRGDVWFWPPWPSSSSSPPCRLPLAKALSQLHHYHHALSSSTSTSFAFIVFVPLCAKSDQRLPWPRTRNTGHRTLDMHKYTHKHTYIYVWRAASINGYVFTCMHMVICLIVPARALIAQRKCCGGIKINKCIRISRCQLSWMACMSFAGLGWIWGWSWSWAPILACCFICCTLNKAISYRHWHSSWQPSMARIKRIQSLVKNIR